MRPFFDAGASQTDAEADLNESPLNSKCDVKRKRLHPQSSAPPPPGVSLWRIRLRAVVRVLAVPSALVALLALFDYVAPPKTDLLIVSGMKESWSRRTGREYELEVAGSDLVSSVQVSKRLYLRADPGDFVRVEHSRRLGLPRRVELLRGRRAIETERLPASVLAFCMVFLGLFPLMAWSSREEMLSGRFLVSAVVIALVYVVLLPLLVLDR